MSKVYGGLTLLIRVRDDYLDEPKPYAIRIQLG